MQFLVSMKSAGAAVPALREIPHAYPPESLSAPWTLRQLVAHLVAVELAAYRRRESDRLLLHALTGDQIRVRAAEGKVAMGGREDHPPPVNDAEAVALACASISRGLVLVFVDEAPVESLDAVIPVRAGLRILFVQLTLLIGR
jgi:hypothetical protein